MNVTGSTGRKLPCSVTGPLIGPNCARLYLRHQPQILCSRGNRNPENRAFNICARAKCFGQNNAMNLHDVADCLGINRPT